MKAKIGIITLGVNDVAASKAFYEKLGFKVRSQTDDFVMFDMEWTVLALFPIDKLVEDVGIEGIEGGTCGITLARNEPSKEAVDKTIEEVRSIGGEIVKEPQEVFWGGYSSYFKDPDGYLWEVAYNPFSPDLS